MHDKKELPEGAKSQLEQFTWKIIHGDGGFEVWEDREWVIHHWSREYSIAAFVLRCLANPLCEGSEEALNAIIEQRKSKKPIEP